MLYGTVMCEIEVLFTHVFFFSKMVAVHPQWIALSHTWFSLKQYLYSQSNASSPKVVLLYVLHTSIRMESNGHLNKLSRAGHGAPSCRRRRLVETQNRACGNIHNRLWHEAKCRTLNQIAPPANIPNANGNFCKAWRRPTFPQSCPKRSLTP